MKIAVLAGGWSPERDVSLTSGSLIADALVRAGHSVCLADVYMGIDLPEDPAEMFQRRPFAPPAIGSEVPDLIRLREESGNGDALIGRNIIALCQAADAVFLAMHGGMGENGQLQAALDCFGIRYSGSGYAGCVLAMDKALTKQIFMQAGILTPPSVTLKNDAAAPETIARQIGFPCVIKPLSCGSSVGVSMVDHPEQLGAALALAGGYEDRILAEKKITGREFTVGVLLGKALPPVEILPKAGFYDYKNKYQSGMTEEICPAALSPEETAEISRAALAVHEALLLGTYSRSDFILSDTDHRFYCLETNALPGMTPVSLLPREAKAAGMSYEELCLAIIGDAKIHRA